MLFHNVQHTILAERESVCMGDDCNAPHTKKLPFRPEELLSEWMDTVVEYVPTMHNVMWSVKSDNDNKVLAYLRFDASGNAVIDLAVPDQPMSELGISSIFCRYFCEGDL